MAEERDDSQEKTEEATPKRQQEARDKGQVARSKEFNTMSVLVGSILIMMIFGQTMINDLLAIMHDGFVIERATLFNNESMISAGYEGLENMLLSIVPILLGLTILAIASPLIIGGWIFSPKSMTLNFGKMNPISGFKRIFGANSLMELLKAMAKFLIVCLIMISLLWNKSDILMHIGNSSLKPALANAGHEILWAFLILSSATFIVALVDVPFQIWEHKRKLKMTKQELKDEMKDTEGRPEVKSQLRAMQQELANQRMMEEVPKADVIITNPTHFAVALLYDQENMRAPKVVAKGADLVAQRIRLIGGKHDVTIFSAPFLARALFHTTKNNQEVPEGLYIAVAQVLAYVYQLKTSKKDWNTDKPVAPKDLPIPQEYQFDN